MLPLMTLSEAINHAEAVASASSNPLCAKEHRQLALWLKELQEYRRKEETKT